MSDSTTDKPNGSGRLSMEEATEILLREQTPPAPPARTTAQPRAPEPREEPALEPPDTSPDRDTRPAEEPDDTGAAEPEPAATEQPDDTADEDPEYEFKVGDTPQRVRLSELQSGYLRQQDYSRKTADLASQRKAFETDQTEVRKERAAYSTLLRSLKAQLEEGQAPVNWEELRRVDPVGFLEQRELQRDRQAKLAAIREEEQRLADTQKREQEAYLQQVRVEAQALILQKIPSWQKPEVRQQEVSDLVKLATEVYGYRPDEIDRIIDPRFVLLARDAMLYHRGRGNTVASKRVSPLPGRPVPSRRSVPQTDPNAARRSAAQAQFSQRPSLNTAVDAILAERNEE